MREIFLLLVVFSLAGCSPEEPSLTATANGACAGIADTRAADAADNGYRAEMQRAIWNEAYQACQKSNATMIVIPPKKKDNTGR